ncbi:MAG: hypothetical protein KJ935_00585 [Candidatus Omnitrophica bacterium]|nr:hypothetical protein [Candidatus Omnitrophota bacterium]
MNKPKIGLLPLYLELYDRTMPEIRPPAEVFLKTIIKCLRNRGVEVVSTPICRLKKEFSDAVKSLEKARVEAIVTLHLAYSPSLESADVLAATKIPIIVLDTTPDFDFGPKQSPEAIMQNHGIHGVQDLCNLLKRGGKPFQIEAGHWKKSDVLDRVVAWAEIAKAVSYLKTARVGQLGGYFKGMGDFAVPAEILAETIGTRTIPARPALFSSLIPRDGDTEVKNELAAVRKNFETDGVRPETLRRAIIAGIAVRRWVKQEKLSAFTFNFLEVEKNYGLPSIPFLEAGRSMAEGIGYAGEGDVLTAALVAALLKSYPKTTFTEMFCPDWKGDSIFLSHMGEVNPALLSEKPRLIEEESPFAFNKTLVKMAGTLKPGPAVLVNLAPDANNDYTLLVAPVRVLKVNGENRMVETVHGWIKPLMPVVDFLAEYSRAGGTHHSALVYGADSKEIIRFGKLMGWKTVILI